MTTAVLALGANLGDRAATVAAALRDLDAHPAIRVAATSAGYETVPMGPPQPDYLNAVALVDTDLDVQRLLAAARAVERAHGRERRERWGARTLDLDVVAAGDLVAAIPAVGDLPAVVVPHPHAHERAFVLVPWLEVDPGAALPGHGRVADLVARLPAADRAGVRATGPLRWRVPV